MTIIIFCFLWSCVNAQEKDFFIDGNALFDDGNSYLYQLQLKCNGADTMQGKVIYTPKNYLTIQQRMRRVFQQSIKIIIDPTTKKIHLQEGNAIGSSNRYGNIVCYMIGELDYIIQNDATFCFGSMIGYDINGDSCSAAFVYLNCNDNIETFCSNKNSQNKKSINKQDYKLAIQNLFSKSNSSKLSDSATLQIATLPTLLLPNTSFSLPHQGDSLYFSISDYDKEDDDLVSISLNGKIILSNYVLQNKPIDFKIEASSIADTIEVTSHNAGLFGFNSALILVRDGKKIYTFKTASIASDKMVLYCKKREN